MGETCALMGYLTHIFFLKFFGENSLTKKSAIADVQLSLVEVRLVPVADLSEFLNKRRLTTLFGP